MCEASVISSGMGLFGVFAALVAMVWVAIGLRWFDIWYSSARLAEIEVVGKRALTLVTVVAVVGCIYLMRDV